MMNVYLIMVKIGVYFIIVRMNLYFIMVKIFNFPLIYNLICKSCYPLSLLIYSIYVGIIPYLM